MTKKPFLQKDHVYLAGVDCPEHIEEAKAYINRMGFTSEDVRLVRRKIDGQEEGELLVIGKRTAFTHHDEERTDNEQQNAG